MRGRQTSAHMKVSVVGLTAGGADGAGVSDGEPDMYVDGGIVGVVEGTIVNSGDGAVVGDPVPTVAVGDSDGSCDRVGAGLGTKVGNIVGPTFLLQLPYPSFTTVKVTSPRERHLFLKAKKLGTNLRPSTTVASKFCAKPGI